MVGYLLKTTVVLTVALLATVATRKRPAALRHFILSFALVGLLLLPLLSLVPFGWRTSLIPAGPAVGRLSGDAEKSRPGPVRFTGPGALSNESDRQAERAEAASSNPYGTSALEARADGTDTPPALAAAGATLTAGPAATAGRTGRTLEARLHPFVTFLWPVGLVILLFRLAAGLAGAVKLTAEGTPLGGPGWRALLDRFLTLVSLRRPVRLKSHPEVIVPLTWGWRKPVVLFPAGADAWTEDERSSALFHELSHIKRADFLVMLLVRTSLALYWWNPLCWVAYREILKAQEIACDELVLRAGIRPSAYAASLLAFRRSAGLRWNPSTALLGMLGRSSFQERLASILRQKIVLMEVKMKTKIMLAVTLVAAVGLVGMARPTQGVAPSEAVTVLADTAMPAAVVPDAVFQETAAAQEKAKTQEKAKAAEKAKQAEKAAKEEAAVEKTIVIEPAGAEGKPIEIVISEGDVVKKLVLNKSLFITKEAGGDILVLTSEGTDPLVLKGEPVRIEIKGGEVKVLKEGKAWAIAGGENFRIVRKIGEEGKTIVFYGEGEPKVVEGKHIEIAEAGEAVPGQVIVKMKKDMKEGETWVAATPGEEAKSVTIVKKGEPTTAWTVKEGDKEGVWVTTAKPGAAGEAFAFSPAASRDMLEKVQALQEQLQAIKAKKMDLSALEESLKKLEAELKAKEEKFRSFEYKFDKEPGTFVFKKSGGEEAGGKSFTWVTTEAKDKTAVEAKAKTVIALSEKDDGMISLLFTGADGAAGQASFERAIVALKKALPDGYTLAEQKYDSENGSMTFKIATPEGKKTDETLVKKLVDAAKSAIDKK